MEKPIYVTLNTGLQIDDDSGVDRLVRHIQEDYLGKTFGELVDKMCDGSADEINQAYTPQEMNVVHYVSPLLAQANNYPGRVSLTAMSIGENPTDITVGLNDKVSDYTSQILGIKNIELDGGTSQRIKSIDLFIAGNTEGGMQFETTVRYH